MDIYLCGILINIIIIKVKKLGGYYNVRKWYLYVNYNFRILVF